MLDLLDVAIGFATVMLAVSLIITSLTQACVAALGLRGWNLRMGLEQLIVATLPKLSDKARQISQQIVRHPLVSDSAVARTRWWGQAGAIKREELLPVLKAVLQELNVTALVEQEEALIVKWFDSFMTRVSQWFVMHTRWITFGLACLLAVALELDSGAVLQQIRTDSNTRAKLSGMTGLLIDQTPDVLARVETVYRQVLEKTVEDSPATFTGKPDAALPLLTRQAAVEWIDGNIKDRAGVDGVVAAYNTRVDEALKTSLERSVDRAQTIAAGLSSAGVILSPAAVRAGPNPFSREFWRSRLTPMPHLFGILVSILFLSLGAPFWFNLLKNLTSLRPAVAQHELPAAPAGGMRTMTRDIAALAMPAVVPGSLPDIPARPAAARD